MAQESPENRNNKFVKMLGDATVHGPCGFYRSRILSVSWADETVWLKEPTSPASC